MRRVAMLACVLALYGCAPEETTQGSDDRTLRERTITLEDGREITCISHKLMNAGGLSCDW